MKILIATDAWLPQVNGVVRTLDNVRSELIKMGHVVHMLTPEGRRTIGIPGYREIQLAFPSRRTVAREIEAFGPQAIHIATEGPIGQRMRGYCLRNNLHFTTSYHSRFPEYVAARIPLPGIEALTYRIVRNFHRPAKATLAPTKTITEDLLARGFPAAQTWTRGVDHSMFRDIPKSGRVTYPGDGPVMIHCGRLAVEKNVAAFLDMEIEGTKVVIGDGPMRASMEEAHPNVIFTGYMFGEELVRYLAGGDVFVFPSRTDTFGLVMIEAMACGLPVAAFPVPGPIDVVTDGESGALDEDLAKATKRALTIPRKQARARAAEFTWERTAQMLFDALVPIRMPD